MQLQKARTVRPHSAVFLKGGGAPVSRQRSRAGHLIRQPQSAPGTPAVVAPANKTPETPGQLHSQQQSRQGAAADLVRSTAEKALPQKDAVGQESLASSTSSDDENNPAGANLAKFAISKKNESVAESPRSSSTEEEKKTDTTISSGLGPGAQGDVSSWSRPAMAASLLSPPPWSRGQDIFAQSIEKPMQEMFAPATAMKPKGVKKPLRRLENCPTATTLGTTTDLRGHTLELLPSVASCVSIRTSATSLQQERLSSMVSMGKSAPRSRERSVEQLGAQRESRREDRQECPSAAEAVAARRVAAMAKRDLRRAAEKARKLERRLEALLTFAHCLSVTPQQFLPPPLRSLCCKTVHPYETPATSKAECATRSASQGSSGCRDQEPEENERGCSGCSGCDAAHDPESKLSNPRAIHAPGPGLDLQNLGMLQHTRALEHDLKVLQEAPDAIMSVANTRQTMEHQTLPGSLLGNANTAKHEEAPVREKRFLLGFPPTELLMEGAPEERPRGRDESVQRQTAAWRQPECQDAGAGEENSHRKESARTIAAGAAAEVARASAIALGIPLETTDRGLPVTSALTEKRKAVQLDTPALANTAGSHASSQGSSSALQVLTTTQERQPCWTVEQTPEHSVSAPCSVASSTETSDTEEIEEKHKTILQEFEEGQERLHELNLKQHLLLQHLKDEQATDAVLGQLALQHAQQQGPPPHVDLLGQCVLMCQMAEDRVYRRLLRERKNRLRTIPTENGEISGVSRGPCSLSRESSPTVVAPAQEASNPRNANDTRARRLHFDQEMDQAGAVLRNPSVLVIRPSGLKPEIIRELYAFRCRATEMLLDREPLLRTQLEQLYWRRARRTPQQESSFHCQESDDARSLSRQEEREREEEAIFAKFGSWAVRAEIAEEFLKDLLDEVLQDIEGVVDRVVDRLIQQEKSHVLALRNPTEHLPPD